MATRKPAVNARVEGEEPEAPTAEANEALRLSELIPSPSGQAVNGDTDLIYLSSAEYKSKKSRRSLTVYHIQRRLAEIGLHDAEADISSYYGDLTRKSVEEFQKRHNLARQDGIMDDDTLSLLFVNDGNVRIAE